jgi:hypothetical protein
MKTKIKSFFKNFSKEILKTTVVFMFAIFISGIVFASLGHLKVSSGDTLTADKWNNLVEKIEQNDEKILVSNLLKPEHYKKYRDFFGKCPPGWVQVSVINKTCVQVNKKDKGYRYYSWKNNYCKNKFGGQLVTKENYQITCSAGKLNGTGVWETAMYSINSYPWVGGSSSCSQVSTHSDSIFYNDNYIPFRCQF